MKTTVHIPDALFEEMRRLSLAEGVSMKTLIEEGVRRAIADYNAPDKRPQYTMRDASFGGEGVHDDVDPTDWRQIRQLIYENHGG